MLPRSLARSMYMIADDESSFDFSFKVFLFLGSTTERKSFFLLSSQMAPNSRRSTNCNVQYNICCVYGDLTRFFHFLSGFLSHYRIGHVYDGAWVNSVDNEAQKTLEKLEIQLNASRTNLMKEATRVCNQPPITHTKSSSKSSHTTKAFVPSFSNTTTNYNNNKS